MGRDQPPLGQEIIKRPGRCNGVRITGIAVRVGNERIRS